MFQLDVYPPDEGRFWAVLRPSAWPLHPSRRTGWLHVGALLQRRIFRDRSRLIFAIQLWRIHLEGGAEVFRRRAREWQPDFGVGVWLEQPPPTLWTEEEFLKAVPGASMRPPIYQIARIQPGGSEPWLPWMEIGGRGSWLAVSVTGDPEMFIRTEAELYRNWIEEPTILAFDLFLPLLRADSMRKTLFQDRKHHLARVESYVRESDEDGGLLILSGTSAVELLEPFVKLEGARALPDGATRYDIEPVAGLQE
ncbi:MAG: hypothetical protein ACUVS7_04915 [Bryobacteraceae bacterium]